MEKIALEQHNADYQTKIRNKLIDKSKNKIR